MQDETAQNQDSDSMADVHKNELITTDDGLDQAIQRAIAQHDLEQQQLEQQNQQEQGTSMDPEHGAMDTHELGPETGENEGFNAEPEPAGHVTHPPEVGALEADALAPSPLLDAAQEKQHLQMIADELKRAATDASAPEHTTASNVGGVKAEDGDFRHLQAVNSTPLTGHTVVEAIDEDHGHDNDHVHVHAVHGHEAPDSTTADVNEEHGHGTSASPSAHGPNTVGPEINQDAQPQTQTQVQAQTEMLQAQAQAQTQVQTQSRPERERDTEAVHHIPANSELLATNNAVAAYNALLSQAPSTALLASAHLAALPLPIIPTSYMPARIQLLVSTLAVLDNLATQLLRVFAVGPYQKIIDLASSPDTAPGAAFRDLTSLFEFTKRLYSEEDPFLTVEHIAPGIWKEGDKTPAMFRSREQTIESTLRKVNLATFLAATLGTIEVGFFHLNESFLHVFCPANDLDPANSMSNMTASNMNLQSGAGFPIGERVGKILKPQASLYLDLKTQAYISAIEAGERLAEEILEDILPSNLEQILQERRCTKVLSPTEIDFINRCNSRKETLLAYPHDHSLNEEYEWFEFLKDLFEFVLKNMGFLLWGKKGKTAPLKASRTTSSAASNIVSNPVPGPEMSATPHSDEVLQELAQRPHVDANTRAPRTEGKGLDDLTAALLPSEIQEQQIHLRINPGMGTKGPNRRPWTRQEEKALRHAMELKGTQWSVILELFGQGGRINESLKNRTQVQLKDKARNWKMFFLKSGLAVPHYLQKVTGDLDREDKLRAKLARNKKTAAAPVPTVSKRDGATAENSTDNIDDELRKKRRVE